MASFLSAVRALYKAQIEEALSTLELYTTKSVGIGEHSDILAEIKKYVDLLDSADSKLQTLDKYFPEKSMPIVKPIID